ncbi:TIGR03560 family F420-dependent LLM class oxidoreductase [Actinospica sp. MGRD01-02]|uniref:TIGR03560 family F420-dependent LLM class oxidoreductase n=1 Tax=Actinospica acidithermotolerans TaxID=2828514 RepID=A0A941IK82_9ACTN|nr:TIGR03560 family F420-dependent LLM class oxidoreductase [Actinospica acidithermotolerans]MBR7826466.1 TIGR03560 family F420-dependent LLM class oxidoreductase [Actinospica acidithermotolerans]
MRFGFKTSPQNTSWSAMLDLWRAADEIEIFESGWTSDHLYVQHGADPAGGRLEGWIVLTALAQATRRLRLGTLVTGIPYRHPGILAAMAATLDIVSGGRLELGIGAGWDEEEAGAHGLALGSPRVRSDRFEEACQVLISLLSPDQPTTDFHGTYYDLTNARCDATPIQRPHPPVVIGGNGEKRTLRTVARYAQHWNFEGPGPAAFSHSRDVLYRHCAAEKRDPAEITLSVQVRHTGDAVETAANAAAFGAAGADLAIIYLPPPYDESMLAPLAAALSDVAH